LGRREKNTKAFPTREEKECEFPFLAAIGSRKCERGEKKRKNRCVQFRKGVTFPNKCVALIPFPTEPKGGNTKKKKKGEKKKG